MKMFYSAYTCKGNIGDVLITKLQIEEYAKYGEVFVDCHGMPDDFQKVIFDTSSPNVKNFESEYGIYYRSVSMLKALHILNRDHFTHFCSSPGPRVSLRMPFHKLCFKLLGVLIPYLFLKKDIKKYALGVDVKYDTTSFLSNLNHWYFNHYDVIGARSIENHKFLQPLFDNVRYVPDMSFLYPDYSPDSFKESRCRIALSFRANDNDDIIIQDLCVVLNLVYSCGMDVDIIYQVEEDRSYCQQLYSKLSNSHAGTIRFIDQMIDYQSLTKYRKYDVVISNRLHVLLLGALNGAIPFALISHNRKEKKVKDIIECVFSENLVHYFGTDYVNAFESVLSNISSLKSRVMEDIEIQRLRCCESFRQLLSSSKK